MIQRSKLHEEKKKNSNKCQQPFELTGQFGDARTAIGNFNGRTQKKKSKKRK